MKEPKTTIRTSRQYCTTGILAVYICATIITVGGCSTVPKSPEAKDVLSSEVRETLALFKEKDPGIQKFFDRSYGYAVLPKVFKGGFWVGGAHGKGEVFENHQMVGYCSMNQATIGFSFGGEFFREIIFFRDAEEFENFKKGNYAFSAQATGVALTAGAAVKADYERGVAVFVIADAGLMVDASLGGQKFNYVAKSF
jgi:lipid-binding SYLF domain-containing protein